MEDETQTTVRIGTGRLSWPRNERVGDRYGAVMLMRHGDSLTPDRPGDYIAPDVSAAGQRGTLVAHVIETRQSTHIGDLFHGFFPTTPDLGETITLGTGTLFSEPTDFGATLVGLNPGNGRDTFWLDPWSLYRAHEQTVRLEFLPGVEPEPCGELFATSLTPPEMAECTRVAGHAAGQHAHMADGASCHSGAAMMVAVMHVRCDIDRCGSQTFVHGLTLEDALARVERLGWKVEGGQITCRKHEAVAS